MVKVDLGVPVSSLDHKPDKCPRCREGSLLSLPSINRKICTNGKCAAIFIWELKKGQKSVLIDNLVGGRE